MTYNSAQITLGTVGIIFFIGSWTDVNKLSLDFSLAVPLRSFLHFVSYWILSAMLHGQKKGILKYHLQVKIV